MQKEMVFSRAAKRVRMEKAGSKKISFEKSLIRKRAWFEKSLVRKELGSNRSLGAPYLAVFREMWVYREAEGEVQQ
jgi:hypothetical protein